MYQSPSNSTTSTSSNSPVSSHPVPYSSSRIPRQKGPRGPRPPLFNTDQPPMYGYLHSHVPSGVTGVRPLQSKIVSELLFIVLSCTCIYVCNADTRVVTMYMYVCKMYVMYINYMFMYVCTFMYICMHVCIYVCMYLCMYVHVYVCTCM